MSEVTKQRGRPSPMMFISLGIGAVVATVLITIVSYFTGGTVTTPNSQSALVGRAVPSFTVKDLQGATITAPWSSGHPTLLVFLASWCAPCRKELPGLAAYLEHHALGYLAVVGVNYNDAPTSARTLLQTSNFTFPVIPDSGALTTTDFGLPGLPDTVLVSSTGTVLAVTTGATSTARLAQYLKLAR